MILEKYPYTSYAEFVKKNPKKADFTTSDSEVEKIYTSFLLFTPKKNLMILKLIEETLQKYPKDVLVPKFTLLNAFNTGKTAGKRNHDSSTRTINAELCENS